MENELKVYESSYIIGLGAPVIVLTGFSTVTSQLFSEYFVFMRGDPDFFDYRRLGASYNQPAPHPIKVDVQFMMSLSLEDAQLSLKRWIQNKWLESRNDRLFLPFELKETSEVLLFRLYLLNENLEQFQKIKASSESPKLRIFLDELFVLPKLVD